jgi:hypothetical protein
MAGGGRGAAGWRAIVVASAGAVLATLGCRDAADPEAAGCGTSEGVVATAADFVRSLSTVAELVEASDVVIVGTVAGCDVDADVDVATWRLLEVEVEDTLVGEVPPGGFVVQDLTRVDDGTIQGADGLPQLEHGDRALFFLTCDGELCSPVGRAGIVAEGADGRILVPEGGRPFEQDDLAASVDGSFDRLVDEARAAG